MTQNQSKKLKVLTYIISGTLGASQASFSYESEILELLDSGTIRWNESAQKYELNESISDALIKLNLMHEIETSSRTDCFGDSCGSIDN